jgi:hypothetical protein
MTKPVTPQRLLLAFFLFGLRHSSSFASIRAIRGLIDSLVSPRSQNQLALADLNRSYARVVPVIGEIIS